MDRVLNVKNECDKECYWLVCLFLLLYLKLSSTQSFVWMLEAFFSSINQAHHQTPQFCWINLVSKCSPLLLLNILKGIFHQFWVYNIFFVPLRKKHFLWRFILIKQLWLEIIEKIVCSKSVRPSTVIYIIYITWTDFKHHSLNYFKS